MGSPYLNSGEAMVLTTNRVSADAVTYDMMLTTERIFLIDNRNERFEPQILPLSGILSVQGGKTPSHDPAITLLFRPGTGRDARQPLNLVFFQNPPENRKHERDEWIKNIIRLSISLHERDAAPEIPPVAVMETAPGDTGLRPSLRHGVAPEMVRPLSNVVDRWRPVTPVTVIPEDVAGSGEIPSRAPAVQPERSPEPAPEQAVDGYATGITPVRGSQPRRTDVPATRVVIPQITEEVLPAPAGAAPPDEPKENAPPEDAGAGGYSRPVPVRPVVMEQPVPEPRQAAEPVAAPAAAPDEPAPEQEPALPPSPASEPPGTRKITGGLLPVREPPADRVMPAAPAARADENVPEQETPVLLPGNESPSLMETAADLHPEPAGTVPPSAQEEPSPPEDSEAPELSRGAAAASVLAADGQEPEPLPDTEPSAEPATAPPAGTGPEPAAPVPSPSDAPPREMEEILRALQGSAGESPAGGSPAPESPGSAAEPPVRGNRPFRSTVLAAAILFLIIVLAAAGAVLLFPQAPGQAGITANTSPAVTTLATPPQDTVRPVTVPSLSSGTAPGSGSAAVTPITTAVPVLSPSPNPLTGIWVRVNSSAYYIGRIGNAGAMEDVSGSGDYFYKVSRNDRPVQVSVRKQDNSGAVLAVTIYRDGKPIATRSVTSPMGSVDLLIDPLTAQIPGMSGESAIP